MTKMLFKMFCSRDWLDRPWRVTVLLSLLMFFCSIQSAFACNLFNNKWVQIASETTDASDPALSLSEFFAELKWRFERQQDNNRDPKGAMTIYGLKWLNGAHPSSEQYDLFAGCLPQDWKVVPMQNLVWHDSTTASKSFETPFLGFIELKSFSGSSNSFLDISYYDGAVFKVEFTEAVLVYVRVEDPNGKVVFLDEFSVTPMFSFTQFLSFDGAYLTVVQRRGKPPRLVSILDFFGI